MLSRGYSRHVSENEAGTGQQPTGARSAPNVREITDARTLRALAHPVRIALLEALILRGPMTATEVGETIGESPTTCSFHLRQLAKYGFVEEAGGGKGRSRPWRVTSFGMSFSSTSDDPEMEIAARTLSRMVRERQLERFRNWQETSPSFPRAWQEAAVNSQFVMYVTADELKALTGELSDLLLTRYVERLADPSARPAGSVPVEMLLFGYPVELPATEVPATEVPATEVPATEVPATGGDDPGPSGRAG